jgi:hypothetical protein
MFEFLANLCLPAMVYLILVILGIFFGIFMIIYNPRTVTLFALISFMIGLFIKLLWIWLLNFLCIKNQEGIAWLLFFLPYIIVFIVLLVGFNGYLDSIGLHISSTSDGSTYAQALQGSVDLQLMDDYESS